MSFSKALAALLTGLALVESVKGGFKGEGKKALRKQLVKLSYILSGTWYHPGVRAALTALLQLFF